MTADRKKAIFFLSLTLIVGIFIGALIPAFFGRFRHHDPREMRGGRDGGRGGKMERPEKGGRPDAPKHEWLTPVVMRVVKPDSDQVKKIRPLTEKAAARIKELETESNGKMIVIMDSLKLQLRPILTEDQNKKLEDFSSRARKRWRK